MAGHGSGGWVSRLAGFPGLKGKISTSQNDDLLVGTVDLAHPALMKNNYRSFVAALLWMTACG